MSMAEVKESIAGMTVEERLELAGLIAHLNRSDDPDYQNELDRRMSAMDSGRKNSAESLKRRHDDLSANGQ
jgi:hypothetical protein